MRNLILAAYHGGQKSVWECFASKYYEPVLSEALQNCLDPRCDRLALFRPDAGEPRSLGKGSISEDSTFILMGN